MYKIYKILYYIIFYFILNMANKLCSPDVASSLKTINRSLSLSTFNCRSVKNSVHEIHDLCSKHDIVLLQEHWLLPFELGILSNIHSEFVATAKSAVDIGDDVFRGRPYGGTAILYRRDLMHITSVIETYDPWLSAIVIASSIGPILMVCVYMPCDTGDNECQENYTATCANISALYAHCDATHLVVAGDFNCTTESRFYDVMACLIKDNNLIVTDLQHLSDAFTYCSDSGLNRSWIDHCLCSPAINSRAGNVNILYDYITSDHRPLVVVFDQIINDLNSDCRYSLNPCQKVPDWSKADLRHRSDYSEYLDNALRLVDIPAVNDRFTKTALNRYYDNILECINAAANCCIPVRKTGTFN